MKKLTAAKNSHKILTNYNYVHTWAWPLERIHTFTFTSSTFSLLYRVNRHCPSLIPLTYLLSPYFSFPLPLSLISPSSLLPSEQTEAKSLNIPNIQRNPDLSLSLSLCLSLLLCLSLAQTHRNPHAFLQGSLSLAYSYTQESTSLSLSGWWGEWESSLRAKLNRPAENTIETISNKHWPKIICC